MIAPTPDQTEVARHIAELEAVVLAKDWLAAQEALIPVLEALPPASNIQRAARMLHDHLPVFESYRPRAKYPRQVLSALAEGKPIPADADDPEKIQGTNPIPPLFLDGVERLELAAESLNNPHVVAVNCSRTISAAVFVNRYHAVAANNPKEWLMLLKHQGKLHREIAMNLADKSVDAQNRSRGDYEALIAGIKADLGQA